ncbi:MAG: hypothetical protein ABJB17_01000 [Burkholderiales bacterium]
MTTVVRTLHFGGVVMRDELIAAVGRAADLPLDQATLAVAAMMRFFTAKLPSAMVGELHCLLEKPSEMAAGTTNLSPPEQAS